MEAFRIEKKNVSCLKSNCHPSWTCQIPCHPLWWLAFRLFNQKHRIFSKKYVTIFLFLAFKCKIKDKVDFIKMWLACSNKFTFRVKKFTRHIIPTYLKQWFSTNGSLWPQNRIIHKWATNLTHFHTITEDLPTQKCVATHLLRNTVQVCQ